MSLEINQFTKAVLTIGKIWLPSWLRAMERELGSSSFSSIWVTDEAERKRAGRALGNAMGVLPQSFVHALRTEMDRGFHAETSSARTSSSSVRSLELMSEFQLQADIERGRLEMALRTNMSVAGSTLHGQLINMFGTKFSDMETCCIGPRAIATAIAVALHSCNPSAQVRACWVEAGCQVLPVHAKSFYMLVSGELRASRLKNLNAEDEPGSSGYPAWMVDTSALEQVRCTVDTHTSRAKIRLLQAMLFAHEPNKTSPSSPSSQDASAIARLVVINLLSMVRARGSNMRLESLIELLRDPLFRMAKEDPMFFAAADNAAESLLMTLSQALDLKEYNEIRPAVEQEMDAMFVDQRFLIEPLGLWLSNRLESLRERLEKRVNSRARKPTSPARDVRKMNHPGLFGRP